MAALVSAQPAVTPSTASEATPAHVAPTRAISEDIVTTSPEGDSSAGSTAARGRTLPRCARAGCQRAELKRCGTPRHLRDVGGGVVRPVLAARRCKRRLAWVTRLRLSCCDGVGSSRVCGARLRAPSPRTTITSSSRRRTPRSAIFRRRSNRSSPFARATRSSSTRAAAPAGNARRWIPTRGSRSTACRSRRTPRPCARRSRCSRRRSVTPASRAGICSWVPSRSKARCRAIRSRCACISSSRAFPTARRDARRAAASSRSRASGRRPKSS